MYVNTSNILIFFKSITTNFYQKAYSDGSEVGVGYRFYNP